MATHHTGGEAQEDSDTDISEQGDRTEKGPEKEKKSVKRKFLHSKAMQRMTGRKRGADVAPAKKAQPPPPAHVQVVVTTAKRTSDTVQQPPKHSQEQDDQQMLFQYRNSPPPPGGQHHRFDPHTQSPGATQQRRPDTSPQQTHATAGSVMREQPRQHPSYSDPPPQSMSYDHLQQLSTVVLDPNQPDYNRLEDKQELQLHHHDDQQLRQLKLENKRLKRDKEAMEKNMSDYEEQMAALYHEISQLRSELQTNKDTKLEMSLVSRQAQVTELTAEKNVLQLQLQGAQTKPNEELKKLMIEKEELLEEKQALEKKYNSVVAERHAALHQVEIFKDKQRTLEQAIQLLREQLQEVKEKQEVALSSREQELQKKCTKMEEERNTLLRERSASKSATENQFKRMQEHYEGEKQKDREETEQRVARVKNEEIGKLKGDLATMQSQLEDMKTKIKTLEESKHFLNVQQQESERKLAEAETEKAAINKQLEHLKMVVETLQQKLSAAQKEVTHLSQERKWYQNQYTKKVEELNHKVETLQQQQQQEKMQSTLDGAKASPHASLEEPQVTEKDREIAELKEKLSYQEQQSSIKLKEFESDLELEKKRATETAIEISKEIEQLRATLSEKKDTILKLTEESAYKSARIASLTDSGGGSSRELEQMRDTLQERSSELKIALETVDSLTSTNASLEVENAGLNKQLKQCSIDMQQLKNELETKILLLEKGIKEKTHQLQAMQNTIESLNRRLQMKDEKHKEEIAEAEKLREEFEGKLVEQLQQHSQLSAQHSELSAQHSELSADFQSLKNRHLELVNLQTEGVQALNAKSRQLEELQNELAIAKAQASMYKEDFHQERKDRVAMNDQLQELKDKSAVIINRLETANKAVANQGTVAAKGQQKLEQLQEDFQISQSQIVAYKKQLDVCKKELEEERRRGQVLQDNIKSLHNENERIMRGANNYQMEQTRANRLEEEVQQLQAQYRELENKSAQLKSSNQILSSRLKDALKGKPQLTSTTAQASPQQHAQQQSPRLEHTGQPVPAQPSQQWGPPDVTNARPQGEHEQRMSQHQWQEELRYQQQQQQQQQQRQVLYNQQPGISQQETAGRSRPPGDNEFMRQQWPPSSPQFSQFSQNDQKSYGSSGGNLLHTNAASRYPNQPLSLSSESLRAADVRMNTHYSPQQPQHGMHDYRPPPVAAVSKRSSHTATHQSLHSSAQYPQFQDDHHGYHLPGHPGPQQHGAPIQASTELPPSQSRRPDRQGGSRGNFFQPAHQATSQPVHQETSQPVHQATSQPAYQSPTAESSSEQPASDTSDVAENPLIEGIDKDMLAAQDEVHKMYADPNDSVTDPEQSFEIPFDPNLVCPKCGRQFRRGEIQKFRKHHEGCTGR